MVEAVNEMVLCQATHPARHRCLADGACPFSSRIRRCPSSPSSMHYAQFSLELMDVCRTFLCGLAFDAVGGIIRGRVRAVRQPCLSTAKANCLQWMMVINDLIPGSCFYALPYMQYALENVIILLRVGDHCYAVYSTLETVSHS